MLTCSPRNDSATDDPSSVSADSRSDPVRRGNSTNKSSYNQKVLAMLENHASVSAASAKRGMGRAHGNWSMPSTLESRTCRYLEVIVKSLKALLRS